MTRPVSLGLLLAAAVPWAVVLAVAGCWLITMVDVATTARGRTLSAAAGIACLSAGSLVFSACVLDRLFPRASRVVVWGTEVPLCLALFASLVVVIGSAVGVFSEGASS